MDIETAVTRHSTGGEQFAGFAASAFAGDAAALWPGRHAMVEGPGPGDDGDDDDDDRQGGDVGNIDPDDDEGYDDEEEDDDEEPLQV